MQKGQRPLDGEAEKASELCFTQPLGVGCDSVRIEGSRCNVRPGVSVFRSTRTDASHITATVVEGSKKLDEVPNSCCRIDAEQLARLVQKYHEQALTIASSEWLTMKDEFGGDPATENLPELIAQLQRRCPDARNVYIQLIRHFKEIVPAFEATHSVREEIPWLFMSGRYLGPYSSERLILKLYQWVYTSPQDGLGDSARLHCVEQELARLNTYYEERSLSKAPEYRAAVNELKEMFKSKRWTPRLEEAKDMIPMEGISDTVRTVLALMALVEFGYTTCTSWDFAETFKLLSPDKGSQPSKGTFTMTKMAPRQLDAIHPHMHLRGNKLYMGTLTGDRWLEVGRFDGTAANVLATFVDVSEGTRPADAVFPAVPVEYKIISFIPRVVTLWMESLIVGNCDITWKLYARLRDAASSCEPRNGHVVGRAWLDALAGYGQVAKEVRTQAMEGCFTQGIITSIYSASEDYDAFRRGVLMRIVSKMRFEGLEIVGRGCNTKFMSGEAYDTVIVEMVCGGKEQEVDIATVQVVSMAKEILEGMGCRVIMKGFALNDPILKGEVPNFAAKDGGWPSLDVLWVQLCRLSDSDSRVEI